MVKTIFKVLFLVCAASMLIFTKQAYAEPVGYNDHQKVNISLDFVFQPDIWKTKEHSANTALEQLILSHENTHKTTGCFNGQVCIHSLGLNP